MRGVVKIKSNFSSDQVEFLDLIISIEKGKLKTNLFIKPSNLQIYLDFMSNHPTHCKVGLVYGQALRIIERCSDPSDADLHLENLKGKLLARSYPERVVQKQFSRARKFERKQLIHQNRKKKKDDKVRCIFTRNEGNTPLHSWFRQAKKCLVKNEKAKQIGEKKGCQERGRGIGKLTQVFVLFIEFFEFRGHSSPEDLFAHFFR